MTLEEAVAKVKAVFGLEPVGYEDNEAVYRLNGFDLFTVSGSGDHTYAALRFRGNPYKVAHLDKTEFEKKHEQDRIEELKGKVRKLLAVANTPADVPEKVEVTVKNVSYAPGGKWECGSLDIDADTPFGEFSHEEVVPGPRHGDDSYELTVILGGHELDLDFLGLDPLDFDPPGKPGKTADKFAAGINAEVTENLPVWLEANKEVLARVAAYNKLAG